MTHAEIIAKVLGGRRAGSGWTAHCPAHDDREPSLSIHDRDGSKVLVRCHAGCAQEQVIAALKRLGLWPGLRADRPAGSTAQPRCEQHEGNGRHREAALAIWSSVAPAGGTLVETYLASRGLHLPLPARLRFRARLNHPTGSVWPAMIALVKRSSDDVPVAIHRTFLARDGSGKAPVCPSRMMLGPCRGGVVRLAGPAETLMLGEGIETCLAAMQATGCPAWACLSTSGLRGLQLPREMRDVIVLADGDAPGEAAAQACAWRCMREGRSARIARPPRGLDFNDLLLGRGATGRDGI